MQTVRDWFHRNFNDPQIIGLLIVLAACLAIIVLFGPMLAPVIAAMVIAYLLEGLVKKFERVGAPRLTAVTVVFLLFIAFVLLIFFAVVPRLSQQLASFVENVPAMVEKAKLAMATLPQRYPELVSEEQVSTIMALVGDEVTQLGQALLSSFSLESLVVVVAAIVYLVLVPLMIFFFLKDKDQLMGWAKEFLPRHSGLTYTVWRDVDAQIGNYVRGKFVEILIVGGVSFITFTLFGLRYSALLAVMVGLSVIIPYVGAAVVTLPVAIAAYVQWGPESQFLWLMVAYLVIQALDGNVLVPILFSEVVNLHPVAIIVAILVFGGIWGFWGVFFAIPLATLIKAVMRAWPVQPAPSADKFADDV